jgi:hypothetical protein
MSWTKIAKNDSTFIPVAVIATTFTKITKPSIIWKAPFGIYPLSNPKYWAVGSFNWNNITAKWGD